MRVPTRRTKWIVFAAVGICGWMASGLLVWQSSQAAFSGSTSNAANNWTSGSVSLSDDDSNAAMFAAVTGLKPGSTGTKCIQVTYGGSLAATVKLYIASGDLTGTLGSYVDLSIDESAAGGAGTFASCGAFSGTNRYSGTLSAFAAAKTDFASGVGSWAPTGAAQTTTYRFTYTVQAAAGNAAQSSNATAKFTWEAQNS
jgi:hypothetical protein